MVIMKQGLEDVSMLLFCLGPALQRTQSYASCNFNSSKSNMWHMVSITQLRLSNRYPYKNSCIPPAYACCQISGPIVAQLVGKCHCSPQRLEEGCHTLYRSLFVWLILTGPIHHCWACWLSLQHDHSKRSNFSTG